MDWNTLFTMQAALDKYIEENNDLANTDIFEAKYLALLVELGELANETRCFKFWSKKPGSDRAVILEEFVDNLHFILSLGIEKEYRFEGKGLENVTLTQTEQFTNTFAACVHFKQEPTKHNYEQLFTDYLQLGSLLGFNEAEIQEAYFKKNKINYERQNQGY
ncbi:MAG TPA: dUTP diphosphatase [Virgibacillus sp.]|nr:dUTP diphosphatase [Virgibacillus sp.]